MVPVAALIALAACSSAGSPTAASGPVTDNAQAVAGTILRVTHGRAIGELRLTQMTGPDAAQPPYPACLTRHASAQRVVNFDLNWAGVNFGEDGGAPAVRVTIAGPDGTALVADIPQPGPTNYCRTVRSFLLSSAGKGWQLVYGMSLRLPSDAKLTVLSVSVDGRLIDIPLSPVCVQDDCFQDDPPVLWTAGTPYSTSLRI